MLLQIPIEHIVFMGFAMHDENKDFFSAEIEHWLQCIFELDVLSQTCRLDLSHASGANVGQGNS